MMHLLRKFCIFIVLMQLFAAQLQGRKRRPPYSWYEYTPLLAPEIGNKTMPKLTGTLASTLVNQSVYVSMTTISNRLVNLHKTISEILTGPVIPDRIFLFISKSPYLIDEGIRRTSITPELNVLAHFYPFSIVYVENIGPHRKLLPLLDRKWREDCVIITMDDEWKYWIGNYVKQLISYYIASGKESVVTLKARRIAFCDRHPHQLLTYTQWGEAAYGMQEFFLLPTGTGGILYRPKFFHPIVFDRKLLNLTRTTDDLAFRLSTMIKGVFVVTGCRVISPDKKHAILRHVGSTLFRGNCSSSPTIRPSRLIPVPTVLSLRNWTSSQASISGSYYTESSVMRRRLKEASLYSNFNMKEGNDKAFNQALQYVADLQLMDMTVYVSHYLSTERPSCFEDHDHLQDFPGGIVSCMIHACRNGRIVKIKRDN